MTSLNTKISHKSTVSFGKMGSCEGLNEGGVKIITLFFFGIDLMI